MSVSVILSALSKSNVPERCYSFVVTQSMHETADFTSNVFRKLNNGFGMKQPSVRPTLSIGESSIVVKSEGLRGYATYNNLTDSVNDLLYWLKYNKIDWTKINSFEDYAKFLKSKGYYGDPLSVYLNGMKNALKRLGQNGLVVNSTAVVFLPLLVVCSGFYLLYRLFYV